MSSRDIRPATNTMEIRLRGTAEECDLAIERLRQVFDVTFVSKSYPDHGSTLTRFYLQVRSPLNPR